RFPEVDSPLSSELRLGDRGDDSGHQHGALSAEVPQLSPDAENAEGDAGDQTDPGPLQEVLDARPAQAGNEQGSDGGLQPGRSEPDWRVPADGDPDAHLVRALPDARCGFRAAARALDVVGSRPLIPRSLLHPARPDVRHHVLYAETYSGDHHGPGAAT